MRHFDKCPTLFGRSIVSSKPIMTLVFFCAATLNAGIVNAQDACVAFYATANRPVRSADEAERFVDLSPDLAELLQNQIEDAFNYSVWSMPFGQARYDDLLYTLDFLREEFGFEFTPGMHAAVVAQFTSPVVLRETMDPLSELFQQNPERVEDLLIHHVGGHKYWKQFGVCATNSPYSFYENRFGRNYYDALRDPETGHIPDGHDRYGLVRRQVPYRNLGIGALGNIIVRRDYLPHRDAPRIRHAMTPCGTDNEPRNIEFVYEAATQSWVRTEPYLEIGTWNSRGFSDPHPGQGGREEISHPKEFAVVQEQMIRQFEERQAGLGDAIPFPTDLDVSCDDD
jgi:hypothetical protein